jgi:hypothetical protein
MSSQRRLSSSRANGAKSRGPSTVEGKLVSSQNATSHGCTANSLVLTNESGDRFQSLLQSYLEELQPTTQLEMDLVEQMAVSKWRQRRLWTVETATIDLVMERQVEQIATEFATVDEPTRLAIAFQSTAGTGSLGLFHRYETRGALWARRSWDRALDRLESMRAKSPEFRNEPSPTNEHSND